MTILAKPSLTVRKTPLIDENRCDEEVIEIQAPPGPYKRHSAGALFCMSITLFLLLVMGGITVMQIYEQVNNDIARRNHYQGFCSIPLSRDIQMLEQRKVPLRWRAAENTVRFEPEVQVVSLLDEDPDHLIDLLKEVLDINIDDGVEKISVFNNGHPVSFVHDFDSNITGIIDEERCFTMELDPSLVLQPEPFALALKRGEPFDVSRVRTELSAALPALSDLSGASILGDKCNDKPTYHLQKDTGVVIRKRSADAPPHDFMQFAGKRVQEIEITNLADILQYEQNAQQGTA